MGHATRDAVVAERLRAWLGADITFWSGGPATPFLRDLGWPVEDVYDPPPFRIVDGRLAAPLRWFLAYLRYYRTCREKHAARIKDIASFDLVVSDEDLALGALCLDHGIPMVLVTDVLDIGFSRGLLKKAFAKLLQRSYQRLLDRCPLVLVPEDGPDRGSLHFIGPIVRPFSADRETIRESLGWSTPTVLVCGGGTASGAFLMERAMATFEALERVDLHMAVVGGPGLSLASPASGIEVYAFVRELQDWILAADVVVTLAGRTTIDEARAAGTPFIAIPLRDHFEQEETARRHGFSFADLRRLSELLETKLSQPRRPIPAKGADRAVDAIIRFLERSRPEPPRPADVPGASTAR